MREILISCKPQEVERILNGQQTILIRKTAPKCELPIEVYIYCTYGICLHDGYKWRDGIFTLGEYKTTSKSKPSNALNGKVVSKFTLNYVYVLYPHEIGQERTLLNKYSCLTNEDIKRYMNGKYVFQWHISNLQIFDKPMELKQFKTRCGHYIDRIGECSVIAEKLCGYKENNACFRGYIPLTRPPANWQYVEVQK